MGDHRQMTQFEQTALVHLDLLYRGALRLTGNRVEAEDLVQDTLLRAFRRFDQFRPGTNCRAWLFAIMRNIFLNRLRQTREVPHDHEFFDHHDPPATYQAEAAAGSPEEVFLQTVIPGDIERALGLLPLVFREVVVLVGLEGFRYQEAADALGCPIGTVMSRLYRGRQLLRRALTESELGTTKDAGEGPLMSTRSREALKPDVVG